MAGGFHAAPTRPDIHVTPAPTDLAASVAVAGPWRAGTHVLIRPLLSDTWAAALSFGLLGAMPGQMCGCRWPVSFGVFIRGSQHLFIFFFQPQNQGWRDDLCPLSTHLAPGFVTSVLSW